MNASRLKHYWFSHGVLFLASIFSLACSATPIKDVPTLEVRPVSPHDGARPVYFTKLVITVGENVRVGSVRTGLPCIPSGPLAWKSKIATIEGPEIRAAFRDELLKGNFSVAGNPEALFEDTSSVEWLVAGRATEMAGNVCSSRRGQTGEWYMKVEWELYSQRHKTVMHTFVSEGKYMSDAGGSSLT